MVFTNLIDIEVIFTNHPDIRRRLMLETKDAMSILNNRILEACEIYPKLSGLSGLSVKSFKKKTEKGFVELKSSGVIGDMIKPKDIIYFDLSFYEIWLDIKMTLESGKISSQISFELKVVLNSSKKEFENTLIHLGIKSWAKIIQSDDYFSFTSITVNYQTNKQKESENILFDYDSTISCTLKFTNISNLIYEQVSTSLKIKSRSFNSLGNDNERMMIDKEYFNNYFEKYIAKQDNIGEFNHIIWKYSNDYLYEDDNNSSFCYDSRLSIISNNMNMNFEVPNLKKKENFFPFQVQQSPSHNFLNGYPNNNNEGVVSLSSERDKMKNSLQMKQKQKKNNPRYKADFDFIRSKIDYTNLINQYTQDYIAPKDFRKKFPDTKNLVELFSGSFEAFEIENPNSGLNYNHTLNYDAVIEGRGLFYYKKLKLLGIIIIVIIIITILIKLIL